MSQTNYIRAENESPPAAILICRHVLKISPDWLSPLLKESRDNDNGLYTEESLELEPLKHEEKLNRNRDRGAGWLAGLKPHQ